MAVVVSHKLVPAECDEVDSTSQLICITDDGSSTDSYNNEELQESVFTLPRPGGSGINARLQSRARPATAARSRQLSSEQIKLTARTNRPSSEGFFHFDEGSRMEYVGGIRAVESCDKRISSIFAYPNDSNLQAENLLQKTVTGDPRPLKCKPRFRFLYFRGSYAYRLIL
jgi:hypothetical protein